VYIGVLPLSKTWSKMRRPVFLSQKKARGLAKVHQKETIQAGQKEPILNSISTVPSVWQRKKARKLERRQEDFVLFWKVNWGRRETEHIEKPREQYRVAFRRPARGTGERCARLGSAIKGKFHRLTISQEKKRSGHKGWNEISLNKRRGRVY